MEEIIGMIDEISRPTEEELAILNRRYTITLSDGTKLTDLKLNGNNFITTTPISKDTFEDRLSLVKISDGERTDTYEHMELVQVMPMPGGEYWFVLREMTKEELNRARLWASIDYLAMMTGTTL